MHLQLYHFFVYHDLAPVFKIDCDLARDIRLHLTHTPVRLRRVRNQHSRLKQ